ncbi:hypothetical protein ACN3YA_000640 [Salmonella enterica subsp. enterica serovar Putten]|uniref:hypothetical protein n=1 Tax=Salmonella enterica TaxID=28901 RepID=UPI0009419E34|nr:hypothetical protein [Salmonella enterica]EHM5999258.1 hypothetical protein [Salmonella enterica]EHQ3738563.1 hypothetical protein [Salmonella enterica]EHR8117022.1 hypothetical protein [Salmonella enterica]EHS6437307.1 hypothetical protein [Salmonella enterica]EHZ0083001.1 hypothetical protein [Salmonella enterica]
MRHNKKIIYGFALICILVTSNVHSEKLSPVAQQVKNIVEKQKLVREPQCVDYVYIPDSEPSIDVVDIVEKHGGSCSGDPQTAPRIFSVFVNKKTHKMESDIDMDDQVNGTRSVFPAAK